MAKQKINFKRSFGMSAVLAALGAMHYSALVPAPAPVVYAGVYAPYGEDCMGGMDGKVMGVDGEVGPQLPASGVPTSQAI